MVNNISGVILAGGANKRFGGITKANVLIDGLSIISRIIAVIDKIFPEIFIVTDRPAEFREFTQCKIIADKYIKAGPLAGIHAALESASADAIFVFAGDMPFPDPEIIALQIDEFNKSKSDVLIPKVGRLIEPLHGIYCRSVVEDLEKFISGGERRAVRDFLNEVNVCYLELPDSGRTRKAFTNINFPSDLQG